MPNHLQGQTSPYLLQHLYNPVDWYPWGEEALEKARRENKPLLVSIGYSACHWCHVMERESFEDEEVARLMNDHFVCIKVDREERPDIDHLYMDAVQLLSGHGGWPLNCFALPDGRPFWGGTYFPKEQWRNILIRIHELFTQQFADLEKQAVSVTEGISGTGFVEVSEGQTAFSIAEASAFFSSLIGQMDAGEGGTKGAPKFPVPVSSLAMLHYYSQTGEQPFLDQVVLNLTKMAMGGIYDQLGGGFARYAVDDQWRIPHFEKMLYDNAQLVSLYAKAYQVRPEPLFREVVDETIGFVTSELQADSGLFYAALDADSEGEEGRYYVWTGREIDEVLGDASPLVKRYFAVGDKGFWEKGKNILLRTEQAGAFARNLGLKQDRFLAVLATAKKKLLQARSLRKRPGLDNKVLTGWNALMIEALADAFAAFQEPKYLHLATQALDVLLPHAMVPDGQLYRKLDKNTPDIPAFLEDYALLTRALIRMYEVSLNTHYLEQARLLTDYVLKGFSVPETNLFPFSQPGMAKLAAPHYEMFDNVLPSSNSVMAHNLFRLANLYENPEWGNRSSLMLRDMRSRWERYSGSFANWGSLLLHHTSNFHTIVVTGPDAVKVVAEINRHYLPDAVVAGAVAEPNGVPVFEKRFKPGETWIHVCSFGYCKQPVQTVEEVLALL